MLHLFGTSRGEVLSDGYNASDKAFCVMGNADNSEHDGNPLSIRRAIALQKYLIELGLPRERVHVAGIAGPIIIPVPGKAEPQNRFAVVNWSSADCKTQTR